MKAESLRLALVLYEHLLRIRQLLDEMGRGKEAFLWVNTTLIDRPPDLQLTQDEIRDFLIAREQATIRRLSALGVEIDG